MRLRILPSLTVIGMLAAPSVATAAFPHTVLPGESLYSIAAQDGLSVSQLAAANGVSSASQLISGSTVLIPPQTSSAAVAPASSSVTPTSSVSSSTTSSGEGSTAYVGDGDNDADDVAPSTTSAATGTSSATSSGGAGGSYLVRPGDTLSAIALRAGTSVAQLAVANGIDPNRFILSGSVLRLPGAGSSSTTVPVSYTTSSPSTGQPVGAVAQGSASSPPYPTPERVSASEVGQIANSTGVSPSLAEAIGWQESGFNNALVSSADARGVMQILPGTWDWINRSLSGGSLAPASAASNVRGGSLLLHWLLNNTGGDPAMAAAGYYQGLSSVQRYGLFSDTRQYVRSVMALRQRFGGG